MKKVARLTPLENSVLRLLRARVRDLRKEGPEHFDGEEQGSRIIVDLRAPRKRGGRAVPSCVWWEVLTSAEYDAKHAQHRSHR